WHLYLLPALLGALSKTPAVLFAPLLLMWNVLVDESDDPLDPLNTNRVARLRRTFVRLTPAFATAVVLCVFVEAMNPAAQSYGGGSRLENLWTQAWVGVRYAGMFVLPTGLSAD